MKWQLGLLPLAGALLLTACAGAPSQPARARPVAKMPAPIVASMPTLPESLPATSLPPVDIWDQLRSSFEMAGCNADPSVMAWARRYTHNPKQFENQLQAVLPRLAYVQQVAAQYGVAGEFVLLPWVESQFRPVVARRRQPAGMWQIMPITAGAMGLRVDGHYDGRLDVPAAAHAVMKLLKQYHDQFHDWRVADYAYNAGEFSVRKLIRKHGQPGETPAIPDWPVRKVTRAHLTKLLAIACIVRQPGRFNVSLPSLPEEQHLVKVKVTQSMPLARAADHAGMSLDTLKELNAAFRSDMIDAGTTSYLLLPASHARQFRNAARAQPPMALANEVSATIVPPPNTTPARKTHTVSRGESLWQIARHYSVNVSQLQRWNHLHGHVLKLGQVLQVSGSN